MYGNFQDPDIGLYALQVALALRTPGWGFHTVRGDTHTGDHRFRAQSVGVVDIWRDSWPEDGILSFPGGVGFTSPKLGLRHRAGRYRPGRPLFSSPVCWSCRFMELFLIIIIILSGWRRVAVALRIPRLGLPHLTGQHLVGGSPFSSLVYLRCKCIKAFKIRE